MIFTKNADHVSLGIFQLMKQKNYQQRAELGESYVNVVHLSEDPTEIQVWKTRTPWIC